MAPARTSSAAAGAAGTAAGRRGQPAQYKQSSRKGKTAWRKNIDLSATEAHLEQMADEVSMAQPSGGGGKPLHALSDTALFVEDRSGQETALARRAREKRPLKSLEILNRNNAGAAPLHARERASFRIKQTPEGKAAAAGMSKKMKDKLRRIAGRGDQVKGAMGELADSQGSVGQEQSGAVKLAQKQAYDVWGSDDTPASSKGKGKGKGKDKDTSVDEEWVTIRDQKPIKAPKTMYEDHVLSAARSIPSVSLPHPGMSYNPDLESHERLIQEAYAIEKRLEDGEQVDQAQRDEWIRKVAEAKELAEQLANSDKRYNGMQVDLPSDGSDDDASNDDEDDENAQGTRKMPKKKTKAQRMRAKRAAQEVAQAKARREAKAQKQLVAQLPKLRKQYEAAARARIAAAEQRRLAKEERLRAHGLEGKKLGKHRVPREKIDVQTGEELSESLRALKPEGNLFRDRYHKMQARALVEPRVPVKTAKRKATKRFETHSYKRFE